MEINHSHHWIDKWFCHCCCCCWCGCSWWCWIHLLDLFSSAGSFLGFGWVEEGRIFAFGQEEPFLEVEELGHGGVDVALGRFGRLQLAHFVALLPIRSNQFQIHYNQFQRLKIKSKLILINSNDYKWIQMNSNQIQIHSWFCWIWIHSFDKTQIIITTKSQNSQTKI